MGQPYIAVKYMCGLDDNDTSPNQMLTLLTVLRTSPMVEKQKQNTFLDPKNIEAAENLLKDCIKASM